ncbi:MAG TPA: hypothetical protein VMG35_10225 [Bryobacteraceae bacterium]|nr:hypothetical protein [Bryobacteraceae bacterium]
MGESMRCHAKFFIEITAILAPAVWALSQPQGTQKPVPYAISISTERGSYRAGQDIRLEVSLTNTSSQKAIVGRVNGDAQGELSGYLLDAYDEKGTVPPLTYYYRVVRGEMPSDGMFMSHRLVTLAPGDRLKEVIIASKLYDLKAPGKYRLQVRREDPGSKAVVKSNTITVTVTSAGP